MEATTTKLAIEDAVEIFHARVFAYDILRRFFVEEPSKEYLKVFIQKNFIHLFPFQEDNEGIKEGVEKIKDYLRNHNPIQIEKHYDSLHWDYTKLFVGPFDLLASPWESVYVHHDGLLFQETTLNVRKTYKKFGFEVKEFNLEADDHIGLELDFMYHMNQKCIHLSESTDKYSTDEISYLLEEQKKFLDEHLNRFVPALTKKMEDNAETDFYKGMAILLRHFITIDTKVLNDLVNINFITKEI